MIFVTVGAQIPFERLVDSVDQWARSRGRRDVFAQTGDTSSPPSYIGWKAFLPSHEFRERVRGADYIIAHAGIGSILAALEFRKPILVFPRRAALRETRNDHQLATARELSGEGLVHAAFDEEDLHRQLDRLDALPPPPPVTEWACPQLIAAIRNFINR